MPFNCPTLFQAWFMGVIQLKELAIFSQSSFFSFLTELFHWIRCSSRLVLLNILKNRSLLSPSFCNWLLHQGLEKCFFFYHWFSRFWRNLDFSYKSSVRASAVCDRLGFVTCFHAPFHLKRYQFAFLMFKFVIVVWGFEFLLQTFTGITRWLLFEGLAVTFKDRMSSKGGDATVRSITDFDVPDIIMCLPSLRMFSWFLVDNF